MRNARSALSRRGFIGGTVTTVGALSAGMFEGSVRAFGGQNLVPSLSLDALKPTGALDEAYWWKVRSQFNMVDGLTFMNNGTLGPMPRVVFDEPVTQVMQALDYPGVQRQLPGDSASFMQLEVGAGERRQDRVPGALETVLRHEVPQLAELLLAPVGVDEEVPRDAVAHRARHIEHEARCSAMRGCDASLSSARLGWRSLPTATSVEWLAMRGSYAPRSAGASFS